METSLGTIILPTTVHEAEFFQAWQTEHLYQNHLGVSQNADSLALLVTL